MDLLPPLNKLDLLLVVLETEWLMRLHLVGLFSQLDTMDCFPDLLEGAPLAGHP